MSKVTVNPVKSEKERSLPVFSELEDIVDAVRVRAHQLFEHRGFGDGHAIDDWLRAENQVCWPAAELEEDDDEYELEVALAGFEPEDIEVTATPSEIIVRAEHEHRDKEEAEGKVWSEFRSNHVLRRVEIPSEIRVDSVQAKYKRGLLKIEARKAESSKKASSRKKKGNVRVTAGD